MLCPARFAMAMCSGLNITVMWMCLGTKRPATDLEIIEAWENAVEPYETLRHLTSQAKAFNVSLKFFWYR